MSEFEKANQVLLSLKKAEFDEPQSALSILKGLFGFIQSDNGEQSLEVEEARATAFMAICEVAKALHRGQPVGHLWVTASDATERWLIESN